MDNSLENVFANLIDAIKKLEQEEQSQKNKTSIPIQVLESGIQHMQDRASTYDSPEGERSMKATVDAFNATTGLRLTEEQGWLFMVLLKAVRSQQGDFKMDNYEDGAAYFGLMAEAAHGSRNNG